MNIAFCFSGQLRDFSFTAASLRKYVLSRIPGATVYVFIHTPDSISIPSMSSALGIPPVQIIVESEDEATVQSPPQASKDVIVISRSWHQGDSFRRFYLQVRSIYRSYELCAEYSRANGIIFDWIFRLRFDNLYFGRPLEDLRSLDPSALHIPKHDNWAGLNDRFAFGGPTSMAVYCSRFSLFSQYLKNGCPMHPEAFLSSVVERSGVTVKRTRVTLHLLRYGSIWPATFKPCCGDSQIPGHYWWFPLWARLRRTRFAPVVNRSILALIQAELFFFQLQHPLNSSGGPLRL